MQKIDERYINKLAEKARRLLEKGVPINKESMKLCAEAFDLIENPEFNKKMSKAIDKEIERLSLSDFQTNQEFRTAIADGLGEVAKSYGFQDANISPDNPGILKVAKYIEKILESGRQEIITEKKFSFSPKTKKEFVAITKIDDPEFINNLEDAINIFLHFKEVTKNMPKLTEFKSALRRLKAKAKAMQDYLYIFESQSNINEAFAEILALRGQKDLLENLQNEIKVLLSTIALGKDLIRDSREKWPQTRLAIELGRLLKRYGVELSGYRQGVFYECLKLVLQKTGSVRLDDSYEQKEPELIHLIMKVLPMLGAEISAVR